MRYLLLLLPLFLFASEPIAPIKPLSYDKAKATLGKILFFDPILSKDGTISCASCHDFKYAGADPRPVSIGVFGRKGRLNSPPVINAAYNFRQFWNGRAQTLQEQAADALQSSSEMDMKPEEIVAIVNKNSFYKKRFKEVFGKDRITFAMILDAIAEFEKALISPPSKFDLYLMKKGDLSKQELQGYLLFKRLGCVTCHNGINIGGNSFQKFGAIIPPHGKPIGDRYEITHRPFDRYRYKVPTLRNITLTAPYFHDASAKTLTEAIQAMALHNLGLTLSQEQVTLLKSFLKTLTSQKPEILNE